RDPGWVSKQWISAYVRHVAKAFPCETNPGLPIQRIRVYKVIHNMLGPGQVAAGVDPNDITLLEPYFMGEYDTAGVLKSQEWEWTPEGVRWEKTRDPLLYWLLPIVEVPKQRVAPAPGMFERPDPRPRATEVLNFFELHAGHPLEWRTS